MIWTVFNLFMLLILVYFVAKLEVIYYMKNERQNTEDISFAPFFFS